MSDCFWNFLSIKYSAFGFVLLFIFFFVFCRLFGRKQIIINFVSTILLFGWLRNTCFAKKFCPKVLQIISAKPNGPYNHNLHDITIFKEK